MLRVSVLLVSVCVFAVGSLSGRGFFCRDPDTGKLHPVNSSWPSISFCGNYNCKLRRKNITNTEYAPVRIINITNLKFPKGKKGGENKLKDDMKKNMTNVIKGGLNKTVMRTDKKTKPDIEDIQIISLDRKKVSKSEEIIMKAINESERDRPDRYLTDKEIRAIAEILHTVKKSDLDAIVEMYNFAQDIYKEIDKTSTGQAIENALLLSKDPNKFKNSKFNQNAKNLAHVSYWYEPIINKLRPVDLVRADILRTELLRNDVVPLIPAPSVDLVEQASTPVKEPTKKPSPIKHTTPKTPKFTDNPSRAHKLLPESYFNGPLSIKDFGKLPYYYPMTNFQRLSSYVHQQQKQQKGNKNVNGKLPNTVFKPVTYKPTGYGAGKYQKEIKPSILLPYPFSYIHHYNWSYPPGAHNSQLHLDEFELIRKKDHKLVNNKNERHAAEPVQSYLPKQANVVLMNPDLENFQDLEIRESRTNEKAQVVSRVQQVSKEERRPEWQTDPIPKKVLEEVRAHVQEKQRFMKPFPLRKKVKLDRLGNLRKIGEMSKRVKRSIKTVLKKVEEEPLEPELFEVYIEKTTCNSDYTIPGFFRYGNLSQPYPECCPQRITNR